MHNAPLKFWIPSRWYWYLILMIARLWNPDRTARSDRKNLEPLSFAVLLASRIILEDKSRDPCEPRSDLTVLRTMIELFLTVLASLWICSLKKKHTHTEKNRRKKKQLLEVHHVFINTATAISKKKTTCLHVSFSSLFRVHHAAPSLQKLFSWANQVLNSGFVLPR